MIWITHWTEYTLLEASERKQRFFGVVRIMRVAFPAHPSSLRELFHQNQMPRRSGLRSARGTGSTHSSLRMPCMTHLKMYSVALKLKVLFRCHLTALAAPQRNSTLFVFAGMRHKRMLESCRVDFVPVNTISLSQTQLPMECNVLFQQRS